MPKNKIVLDLLTDEQRAFYEERLAYWDKKFKPLTDAIRRSQMITGDDLNIRVGPCTDQPIKENSDG